MARTTSIQVQAILNNDYDTSISLSPFIEMATAVTDRVATCSSNKGLSLSTTELELIERWLSAHFYVMSDQTYREKETENARGVFHGETGMYFEASKYGQSAINIDYSGCLKSLMKPRVGGIWLGKPASEKIPYSQRD